MRGYLPKISIISVLALVLNACGGGSGTSTDEEIVSAPTMTLSILDSLGADTTQVNGDVPVTVRAVFTDGNGTAVVGAIVTFSTTVGLMSPSSGTDLTVAGGIAEILIGAGTVEFTGSVSATASVDGLTASTNSPLQSDGLSTVGGVDVNISLDLTFTDSTPLNVSNIITSEDNATITVSVEDTQGTALPNRTASIITSLGTVAVPGGTAAASISAISDSEGRISVTLTAGATLGTGDLTVVVEDETATVQFEVVTTGLQIGTGSGVSFVAGGLDIGLTPLSAGGTSTVSVVVVDSLSAVVSGIDIAFSSTCSTAEIGIDTGIFEASISATVTSNALGIAQATYEASGCEGSDIITAQESSSGQTATGTIVVFPPVIGSIVFDSVTDSLGNVIETIFFQDSGGISTAKVIFQVLDVRGDPVEDEQVTFELSTTVGGIELQNASALTDEDGKAVAVVNSGFVQTTLKVKATIAIDTDNDGVDDDTLDTLSGQLSVNTGVADDDSFSLATTEFNFEGADYVGETVILSVALADKFNNPVPDGTAVSFRTEFGRIEPSCNTVNGDCSVVLNSQEPRSPLVGSHQDLGSSGCPSSLIFEEVVTLTGGEGNTEFLVSSINRVEKGALAGAPAGTDEDQLLVLTTDYTVDEDGLGIICASTNCSNETNLKITYTRFPDEDDSNDTTHVTTESGMATPPYRTAAFQGLVPCRTPIVEQGGVTSGYNGGLGQFYGIRSTVLAFAQGEESFIDRNGNGTYDYGEIFVDLTEAIVDFNEDNVYGNGNVGLDDSRDETSRECYGPRSPITDPDEELGNCYQRGGGEESFIDFNSNTQFDGGNGIYNGTLCPKEIHDRTDPCDNGADLCDEATEQYCTRALLNIGRSVVIILSGSFATFSMRDGRFGEYVGAVDLTGSGLFSPTTTVQDNDGDDIAPNTSLFIGHDDNEVRPQIGDSVYLETSGSVFIDFADEFNSRLPTGTSIAVSVDTGGCLIGSTTSSGIASGSSTRVDGIGIAMIPNPDASGTSAVTVILTTPNGNRSLFSFLCTTPVP